jgi:radial spoke head protein 1
MSEDGSDNEAGDVYEIVYKGEKEKGAFVSKDGEADCKFPNGNKYSGSYKDRKRNGRGKYTWNKTTWYDGEYKDNKKEGTGTMAYPDGSKYVGEWANNERHGRGTYTYANGDRFCGTWVKGARNGPGTYLYAATQTQLSGNFTPDGKCEDGTWEFFDGQPFVCVKKGDRIVQYGDRVLA